MLDTAQEYFFQVVHDSDSSTEPQWPHPVEDLVVGHQPIGSGYTQYWAYPKESSKEPGEIPPAEVIASRNQTDNPAILIDQVKPNELELVLVKDGHAWIRTTSSAANLEDNLTSIIEQTASQFNLKIEHFMTTDRVSAEIEKRLDDLEESDNNGHNVVENEKISAESVAPHPQSQPQPNSVFPAMTQPKKSFPLGVLIPLIVVGAVFAGVIIFRDQIMTKINSSSSPVAKEAEVAPPAPTVSPTPTPVSVERSEYKVRVLNGTKKSGAAGALATKLKDLDWVILSTGNAANTNTLQTTIKAKSDLKNVAAALLADLGTDFQATIAADLKSNDKADVEVTIGKE